MLIPIVSLPAMAGNVTFAEIPVPNLVGTLGNSIAVSENGVVAFADDTRFMTWSVETGLVVLGEPGVLARLYTPHISTDGNVVAFIETQFTGNAYV